MRDRAATRPKDARRVGLTFDELSRASSRHAIVQLRRVLADEVAAGRVVLDDDVYALNPDAFDRELLVALQRLDASDVDETRVAQHANGRRDPYSAGREAAAWA